MKERRYSLVGQLLWKYGNFFSKQKKKSIKVVSLGIDEGIQDETENLTQNLGMEICRLTKILSPG